MKKISCPVKLNLTLRVRHKKKDSFHEIYTIFLKKKGKDELTISPQIEENIGDIIEARGEQISGENIISRALRFAREKNGGIPPLRIIVNKNHPVGSGIGAGSGNAAAVLLWLEENYGLSADASEIVKLGADVAFLAAGYSLMRGEGIGDVLTKLEDIPDYRAALAFPSWATPTKAAYEKLDESRELGGAAVLSAKECGEEAEAILGALRSGKKTGLLPNDFLKIYSDERLAHYKEVFNIYDGAGALAWGLCGSGGAVFALFAGKFGAEPVNMVNKKIESLSWVKKTAELE